MGYLVCSNGPILPPVVCMERYLFVCFSSHDEMLVFLCSHYASCLDYLGNLKPNLLLDIHLHDHVETLYDQIRHKALIQYTLPFVSVDLHMMANAFKTSVAGLEKELETLITNNQIQVSFPPSFFVSVLIFIYCCCLKCICKRIYYEALEPFHCLLCTCNY